MKAPYSRIKINANMVNADSKFLKLPVFREKLPENCVFLSSKTTVKYSRNLRVNHRAGPLTRQRIGNCPAVSMCCTPAFRQGALGHPLPAGKSGRSNLRFNGKIPMLGLTPVNADGVRPPPLPAKLLERVPASP